MHFPMKPKQVPSLIRALNNFLSKAGHFQRMGTNSFSRADILAPGIFRGQKYRRIPAFFQATALRANCLDYVRISRGISRFPGTGACEIFEFDTLGYPLEIGVTQSVLIQKRVLSSVLSSGYCLSSVWKS